MSFSKIIKMLEEGNKEIRKTKNRIKKEVMKNLEPLIVEELKKTGAVAIRWEQYTPYFNDGDACIFGVNVVRVRPSFDLMNKIAKFNWERFPEYNSGPYKSPPADATYNTFSFNEGDYEDDFLDAWTLLNIYKEKEMPDDVQKISDFINNINEFIHSIDASIMEDIFGEHVVVTITTDGIEIEHYEHD